MTVTFACGHTQTVPDEGGGSRPICQQCGETRIMRVTAPPPTFQGLCTGPRVTR